MYAQGISVDPRGCSGLVQFQAVAPGGSQTSPQDKVIWVQVNTRVQQLIHGYHISSSPSVIQGGQPQPRGGPSLHWAIGQEIATKCYQIDVTGVAILHVLCHGTGVASHREVRVTIGLDLLCSGLMTPSYIT